MFVDFIADVEPQLRRALVATFGGPDGRAATVNALSWAWEHWDRISVVDNPVAYLYRVGQTSMRHRHPPTIGMEQAIGDVLDESFDSDLVDALRQLPEQQRLAVVFVKVLGWSQADLADVLDVAPSTVHAHLTRGLARLRIHLEVDQIAN